MSVFNCNECGDLHARIGELEDEATKLRAERNRLTMLRESVRTWVDARRGDDALAEFRASSTLISILRSVDAAYAENEGPTT